MSVLMRRLLVLVAFAACQGQTSVGPVARPAPITTVPADRARSCEDARALRAKAEAFFLSGRLEKTLRAIQKANSLCVAEGRASRELLKRAEAELGTDDVARDLAGAANVADGNTLLRQALANKAAGDAVGARKLFDRARIAMERASKQTVTLDPRSGLWDASVIGWAGTGALAVAAGADVHLFRGQDFSEFLRLRTNANRVTALAVSADARTLVSAGAEQDPEIWDLLSGKRLGTLARTEAMSSGSVSSLAFSPDGKRVAGRTWENAAPALWDTATSNTTALDTVYHDREWGGIRGSSDQALWPEMLAFSPDGTKLATVQNDALLLWELRAQSPQIFRVLRVPDSRRRQESLASVILQPKGRGIAAGSESGRILVWDSLATSQPRFVQATHPNVRLAYNRDGAKLLSASSEGDLRTFATKTLSTLSSQKHQAKTISAIAPSSDGSSVAIAADGGLAVIDTASGKTTEVVPRPVAFTSLTAW